MCLPVVVTCATTTTTARWRIDFSESRAIEATRRENEWTSRRRKDVNNTARDDDVVVRARAHTKEGGRERDIFVNGENVDDSMTHEVLYRSRNIGRHDDDDGGGGSFAPRVLETGKVHGVATESRRNDRRVYRSSRRAEIT